MIYAMVNFILSSFPPIASFSHGSTCWENGDSQSNSRTIINDLFTRNYIEDLLKNIRKQLLLKLIKPYTRIRIFISKELNVPEEDVEQLLVSLILDNRIQRHINQVNRLLEHGNRSEGMKKYAAVEKEKNNLNLYQTISNRVG